MTRQLMFFLVILCLTNFSKQQDFKVDEELLSVKQTLQQLQTIVEQQQQILQQQQQKITQQQLQVQEQQQQISEQQQQISEQQQQISQLQHQDEEQQQKVQEQAKTDTQLKHQLENLESVCAEYSDNQYMSRTIWPVVGFSAYANRGDYDYEGGQIIEFEGIEYNNPKVDYNPEKSTFTCPVTGVYFFTVNAYFVLGPAQANGDRTAGFRLMRAGEIVAEARQGVSVASGNAWTPGSNSVVTTCAKGDTVYVVSKSTSTIRGRGRVTTFSGFLLAI